MLFAAALVASVPCDGSPALACEVNTLAPTNSSGVWALMGGHDGPRAGYTRARGCCRAGCGPAAEVAACHPMRQWWGAGEGPAPCYVIDWFAENGGS